MNHSRFENGPSYLNHFTNFSQGLSDNQLCGKTPALVLKTNEQYF